MKQLNQKGIAHLFLIVGVVILLTAGVAAFKFIDSRNSDAKNNQANSENASDQASQESQDNEVVDEANPVDDGNDDTDKKQTPTTGGSQATSGNNDSPKPTSPPTSGGFNVSTFHQKVQVGMTYDEVRKLAGKDPEGNCPPDADCLWSGNCMDVNGFPKAKMTCYWYSDVGRATINFDGGKVVSKSPLVLE